MGKFFVWKPVYAVGIDKIDEQHKKLVEIINDFYSAFVENKAKEKLGEILDLLLDYTQYHFSTEEQLFLQSNYKDTIEHIEQHKKFVVTIKEFINEYKAGSGLITFKLMNFLRVWLTNHIMQEDHKYSEHLVAYIEKEQKTV